MVNAKTVKNVPGRKSDVLDCQWLQQLHSYGLLAPSFVPEGEIAVLRSYLRQRENLIQSSTSHVQRMQKALTQMNLQLPEGATMKLNRRFYKGLNMLIWIKIRYFQFLY